MTKCWRSLSNFICLILLSIGAGTAHADVIGPSTYLRKLSFHIKGVTPGEGEYAELGNAIKQGREQDFFRKKTGEYLSSKLHSEKMDFRLSELFYLEANPTPIQDYLDENDKLRFNSFYSHNSLNVLFRRIAAENLSWDVLLTGKEYEIFGEGTSYSLDALLPSSAYEYTFSDFGFYGALRPKEVPKVARGLVRDKFSVNSYNARDRIERKTLKFEDSFNQAAGSLTTYRFFQRYTNSSLNKNRRRAKAIYRIFLCDSVQAMAFDQDSTQQSLLALFDPRKNNEDPFYKEKDDVESEHGRNINCKSCHQRLDPLGDVFKTSALILSPIPSPGAIVIRDPNGRNKYIPIRNFNDLGQKLTKQDEYLNCQVSHFWKWFIGEDIPLDHERREALKKAFNDVGRRTNDFISYLVGSPEFKIKPGEQIIRTEEQSVKVILDKCNSCHLYSIKENWDYDLFFRKGHDEERDAERKKIIKRLDLEHGGKKADMPPKWSKWELTPEERKMMWEWLKKGHGDS